MMRLKNEALGKGSPLSMMSWKTAMMYCLTGFDLMMEPMMVSPLIGETAKQTRKYFCVNRAGICEKGSPRWKARKCSCVVRLVFEGLDP